MKAVSQKVQTSSCKYWGYNAQCDDCSQHCYVVYLKVPKRVDPKSSYQKEKKTSFFFWYLYEVIDVD